MERHGPMYGLETLGENFRDSQNYPTGSDKFFWGFNRYLKPTGNNRSIKSYSAVLGIIIWVTKSI